MFKNYTVWKGLRGMRKYCFAMIFILMAALIGGCSAMGGTANLATATPVTTTLLRDNTVSASAEVVPAKWTALGMSSAEIVADVLIEDGEMVKAEQVLVRLIGQEDIQAKISAAEYNLADAQRALENLKINASSQAAQAQKAAADAQKAVEDAQKKVDSLTYGRASDTTIENTESKLDLAKQRLAVASDNYRMVQNRSDGDELKARAKLELTNAQIELNNRQAELNWYTGKATDTETAQYYANLALAQSQLADAQRHYEIYKNGPDPMELKVGEALVANAEAQLAAARNALTGLELKAPFAGVVSNPRVRIGEYLSYGQPVLQLADLSTMRVETIDLNETDVARVQPGDPANVTFDALAGENVAGKVVSIAPKASEGSGVNYTVAVLLDELPEGLRWGMTAFVVITVSK